MFCTVSYCKPRVVIVPTLSPMVAPAVAVSTAYCATNGGKVNTATTHGFQWLNSSFRLCFTATVQGFVRDVGMVETDLNTFNDLLNESVGDLQVWRWSCGVHACVCNLFNIPAALIPQCTVPYIPLCTILYQKWVHQSKNRASSHDLAIGRGRYTRPKMVGEGWDRHNWWRILVFCGMLFLIHALPSKVIWPNHGWNLDVGEWLFSMILWVCCQPIRNP